MDGEFPDALDSELESGVFSPPYLHYTNTSGFRSPVPSYFSSAMASPARQEAVDEDCVLPGVALPISEATAILSRDVSDEDAFALALRAPTLGLLTDVKFMVGRTTVEEIHAHSLILARKSDYFFKALLRHNDVHNRVDNGIQSKTFGISNMEPGGFRIMLGYLYNKKIDLPPIPSGGDTNNQVRLLLETLQCSKVINEPELETICTALLVERLTVQNSINCLNIATKYKCTTFQQKVIEFIGSHLYDLIWTEEFNAFSENALVKFLEFDEWYLPEAQVFDLVVEWARNKHRVEGQLDPGYVDISSATLRSVMGRTLRAIRFPLMSFDEQRDIAVQYPGLLTDRERLQLYDHMLILESGDAPPFTARRRNRPVANHNQEENGGQNQNEQNVSNVNENRELENVSNTEDNQEEIGNENETEDASTNNLNDKPAAIEPTQRKQRQEDDNMPGTGSVESESSVVLPPLLPDSIAKDHEFKAPPPKKSKQSTPMPSTSKAVRRQSGRQKSGGALDEGNQGQGEEITSLQNYVASLKEKDVSHLTVIDETMKLSAPKHRINLPCLKNFNLKLETNRNFETGAKLKKYIGDQSVYLHRMLFFKYDGSDGHNQLPEQGQGDYLGHVLAKIMAHIFNHRINVCITISDVQVLKICHKTGTLSINMLRRAQNILDSCTEAVNKFTLKKLALNECVITLNKISTKDLETVTMRQMKGPNNKQGNLLKNATNMKEFVILGSNTCCGNLDLNEDILQVMPQLQKLCLSRCTLYMKNEMSQHNLQELFLDDVVASPAVYEMLPHKFQHIRKLCIEGKNLDPECLCCILNMSSIECIFGSHFVYSEEAPPRSTPKLEELYHFLATIFDESFAMNLSTPFLLQRKQTALFPGPMDHRDWVGTKIETEVYAKFQEMVFESKLLDTFFDNLERFQFFIKPKEANRNGETVQVRRTTRKRKARLTPKRSVNGWL